MSPSKRRIDQPARPTPVRPAPGLDGAGNDVAPDASWDEPAKRSGGSHVIRSAAARQNWDDDDGPPDPVRPGEGVDPERASLLEGFSNRELMAQFLRNLGEDPAREGLRRTPFRVEKAWEFVTEGYATRPEDFLNNAVFESNADEMVLVKDIQFYSMCEHHLLPFTGVAHVAYLPAGKIVGLSKIPRIVDMFARRLQVQEHLTSQVADCVNEVLRPRGVAVVMEAAHFCMMMRGVQKQQSRTVTSAMLGEFRENSKTRDELLRLIHSRSPVL